MSASQLMIKRELIEIEFGCMHKRCMDKVFTGRCAADMVGNIIDGIPSKHKETSQFTIARILVDFHVSLCFMYAIILTVLLQRRGEKGERGGLGGRHSHWT